MKSKRRGDLLEEGLGIGHRGGGMKELVIKMMEVEKVTGVR